MSMWIKAAPGCEVVYPDGSGRKLPHEATEVVMNSYWLRRLQKRDVVECDPPIQPKKNKES